MTLDFSLPRVFAAPKTSEGDFVHSIWDWQWEGLVAGRLPRCPNWGERSAASFGGGHRRGVYGGVGGGGAGSGGDWSDEAATHESVYGDILDLLPSDPFGMEMGSNWTAAITGWLEDLSVECQQGDHYKEVADAEYGLFAGINFLCNNAAWLSFDLREQLGKSGCCYDKSVPVTQGPPCEMGGLSSAPEVNVADEILCHWWIENQVSANNQEDARKQNTSQCSDIVSVSNTLHDSPMASSTGHSSSLDDDIPYDGLLSISNTVQDMQTAGSTGDLNNHGEGTSYIEDGHAPHDGLFYALRYLEVQDLLSVERVCKTLRSAVRNDPLLWRCIHIGQPLNERLTDDGLFQLAQRADGNLQCLNLVQCLKITNDGLTRVLESNPHLTKLSVPGCRLSIEALLDSLKLFNAPGMPGIKQLRIGGLYGVTQAHYDELKQILGMDGSRHHKARKPQFHRAGSLSLPSCDYDDELDVELCPICQNLRVVYDCPSESCKGKSSGPCRGCNICIARCVHCGRCLNDSEYEETFYLDCYCLDCVNHLVQSEEAPSEREGDLNGPAAEGVEKPGDGDQQATKLEGRVTSG